MNHGNEARDEAAKAFAWEIFPGLGADGHAIFMNKAIAVIALSACLLSLTACDKTPPAAPPAPIADTPVPPEPGAAAGSDTDPSVPPAETVFPPASSPMDPETTETDGTRRPAMEPEAEPIPILKPIPGQNNDHSAPLSTDE